MSQLKENQKFEHGIIDIDNLLDLNTEYAFSNLDFV